MSTIIVIPTFNERENLPVVCSRVWENLPEARLLIVDDHSPDGTGELADELALEHPARLSVLHRPGKAGLGAAYVAAFQHVLAEFPDVEFVVQMDADLSHDPSFLPAMLDAAKEADVAVGSRYVHGVSVVNWPLNRLLLSRIGTAYIRLITGLPLTDCTGGFKCYRAEILRSIDFSRIRSSGYCFQIEMSFRAWRHGFRLKDVPIVFYERQRGQSKLSLGIAVETLKLVARLGMERLIDRRP